ncbi:MAG: hypothetical protein ACOX5R_07650 [bacterium]|jgi:hypothetical protein
MHFNLLHRVILLGFLLGCAHSVWCGGPLVVNQFGRVIKWNLGSTLVYRLDQGKLGNFSRLQAEGIIFDSFRKWENAGVGLAIARGPDWNTDITHQNYSDFSRNFKGNESVVVFDDDGRIINMTQGEGARDHILGFQVPYTNSRAEITGGIILFNGYFFDEHDFDRDSVLPTILHELGHYLGLDHSQQLRHLAYNGVNFDDVYVPIMFPTTTDNEEVRSVLTFDDQVALRNLYPTAFHRNSTGKIEGNVKRSLSGKGLPGVNVIAYKADDPLETVTSTVTGTYEPNTGDFLLEGLPPGDYYVMVEAIDPRFVVSSRVGQYAYSSRDASFDDPVQQEYFNHSDNNREGRSKASPVNVRQGRSTSDINIRVNSANKLEDEVIANLIGIGLPEYGSAPYNSSHQTFYSHLLDAPDDADRLDMEFTFYTEANVGIRVEMESGSGFTNYEFEVQEQNFRLILADGGDIPLKDTRYFITVFNFNPNDDAHYSILVTENDEPVPTSTPTPQPTYTPTNTPTNSPTYTPVPMPTSTPTRVLTPTFTPRPGPTFTPVIVASPVPSNTPVMTPVSGDITGNGTVDAMDLYAFARDWQRSATDTRFSSKLIQDASDTVGKRDLLILIEWMRRKE